MNPLRATSSHLQQIGQIVVFSTALLCAAVSTQAQTWNTTTGNWADGENWTGGTGTDGMPGEIQPPTDPATYQTAVINNGGVVTVNSVVDTISSLQIAYGSNTSGELLVQDGASLTGTGTFSLSAANNQTLSTATITQTGGSLTFTGNSYLGRFSANHTATYRMSGGSLNAFNLSLGADSANGYFYQTGGAVTLGGALGVHATSLYEISGGSLSVRDFTFTGVFRVIGSGASSISASRNFTINTGATMDFRIDNGGITRVSKNTELTLAGNLSAGFKGGVALTTGTSFQVLEARGFNNGVDAFASTPNAALWDTAIQNDINGTRDAVAISYTASANVGTLLYSADPETPGTLSFDATTTGYASVTGLPLDKYISLYLQADAGTGKTLADLVAYFTENGLSASLVSEEDFNIRLTFDPTAATSYFGWDLSDFNETATLSGLGATIPEPSTWVLLTVAGCLLIFLRKRGSARA